MRRTAALLSITTIVCASGCAVAPPPPAEDVRRQALADIALDGTWRADASVSTQPVLDDWISTFNDPALDALVRDSDDRLLQRLMFAVAKDPAGATTVILRTRPSKLAPPHLPLDNAVAFKPFWKLQNLFVPVGHRLHPTLRRDAVRKLLADDADTVVDAYREFLQLKREDSDDEV